MAKSNGNARPLDKYIRVSRVGERGGDPAYGSPEIQSEAIDWWAQGRGVPIAETFIEEDETAGERVAPRPLLEQAIQRAIHGETDGIVFYNISRFSRFTEQGLADARRLREAGARLVFVSEGMGGEEETIDTRGGNGKLIFTILLAMQEAALDTLKAGWRKSKERAIREGRQIGPTPLGYRRATVKNGVEKGQLVPDPETAPAITAAYKAAARDGLEAAVSILQEAFPMKSFVLRKAVNKRGENLEERYGVKVGDRVTVDATWNITTARRLLKSPVYIGEAFYGDEMNPKAHEPLIDRRTFNRAQYAPLNRNSPAASYPLSGIAQCATCGNEMIGARAGVKRADGYPRNYRCSSASRKDVECAKRAMIDAAALENYVIDQVALALDAAGGGAETIDLADLERAVRAAEEALDEWAGMPREDRARLRRAYQNGLDQRVEELEEAEAALAQAQHESEHGPGEYADLTGNQLRDLTEAAWREALPRLVQSVVVKPGRGLQRAGKHGEGPSARIKVTMKSGRGPRVAATS
jgi:DNA invertase Pin-like site-specific DNA recombinase